jgi:hypothetical protein
MEPMDSYGRGMGGGIGWPCGQWGGHCFHGCGQRHVALPHWGHSIPPGHSCVGRLGLQVVFAAAVLVRVTLHASRRQQQLKLAATQNSSCCCLLLDETKPRCKKIMNCLRAGLPVRTTGRWTSTGAVWRSKAARGFFSKCVFFI